MWDQRWPSIVSIRESSDELIGNALVGTEVNNDIVSSMQLCCEGTERDCETREGTRGPVQQGKERIQDWPLRLLTETSISKGRQHATIQQSGCEYWIET